MIDLRAASRLIPVLTLLLWPLGVVLLWLSPQWTYRDKLLGTLMLGLLPAWLIATGRPIRETTSPMARIG